MEQAIFMICMFFGVTAVALIAFTLLIVSFPIVVAVMFLIRRRALRRDRQVGGRPEGPDEV